jgi:Bacterial PH domain
MSIDKLRAQVIGSIWQAIAQSGVDLSSVSQDQQEKIVSKIADGVMVTMDAIIEEQMPLTTTEDEVDEADERVLWKGRPLLSLIENYTITSERLKIITGLVSKHVENFELIRIQDIDFKQGMGERMVGVGDITIRGHDPSNPEIVLRNVSKPEEVYEIMRKAWLDARKRHGLQFREYM